MKQTKSGCHKLVGGGDEGQRKKERCSKDLKKIKNLGNGNRKLTIIPYLRAAILN